MNDSLLFKASKGLIKNLLFAGMALLIAGCTGAPTTSSSQPLQSSSEALSSAVIQSSSDEASSSIGLESSSQAISSSSQHSQTSSEAPLSFEAFDNADGNNGAQLYAKFWAVETDFSLRNSTLSGQAQLDNIKNNGDFFRCTECHGWDRLGRNGGYSNHAPSNTRPNVTDLNLASISKLYSVHKLFDAIKQSSNRRSVDDSVSSYNPSSNATAGDRMPNYSEILTDGQIWDLVKFLKAKDIDAKELYTLTLGNGTYPNRITIFTNIGTTGNAFNGDQIYRAQCSTCHGNDGTAMLVDGGAYTVGAHLRAKPYKDQHTVRFGHQGSIMGEIMADAPTREVRDLFAALSNTFNYPDKKTVVIPADGVSLFNTNCAGCHTARGMGSNAFGDVSGATLSAINNAIKRVARMASLNSLEQTDLDAIAKAIK